MDLLLWIMLHSIAHGLKPYGQNSVPFYAVNCFIDRRAWLIPRYVEITILSKIGELQKSVFLEKLTFLNGIGLLFAYHFSFLQTLASKISF